MPVGHEQLHFPGQLPTIEEIRDIVGHLRSGDFVGVGTVDHIFWTGGNLNAMRGEPQTFGAGLDAEECPCGDPRTASDAELADALEQGF
jgi:hypothetical protein